MCTAISGSRRQSLHLSVASFSRSTIWECLPRKLCPLYPPYYIAYFQTWEGKDSLAEKCIGIAKPEFGLTAGGVNLPLSTPFIEHVVSKSGFEAYERGIIPSGKGTCWV